MLKRALVADDWPSGNLILVPIAASPGTLLAWTEISIFIFNANQTPKRHGTVRWAQSTFNRQFLSSSVKTAVQSNRHPQLLTRSSIMLLQGLLVKARPVLD